MIPLAVAMFGSSNNRRHGPGRSDSLEGKRARPGQYLGSGPQDSDDPVRVAGRRRAQQGSSRVFVLAAAIAIMMIGMAVAVFLMMNDVPQGTKDFEEVIVAEPSFQETKSGF